MASFTRFILAGVVLGLLVMGCGDDGGSGSDVERPSVTQTSPQAGASDVNLNPLIQVWFDEALDDATIDSAAFHVEAAQTHRLDYDDTAFVVALYLRDILEPDSTYQVVIKSSIAGAGGNPMLSDYTFSFTTGPLDCAHLEDYLEPNDDMNTAPELELDKTYTVLSSCGAGEFDYYRFTLSEGAKITARVDHSYSELDATGWIMRFRQCGGPFYRSMFIDLRTDETINLRFSFVPGTYCLETGNTEGEVRGAVYDLTLESSAPCPDDIYEDNDFVWESKPIAAGQHSLRGCMEDRDYFKISLDAGQTLTATVSQVPPGNSQRRLEILDIGGSLLTGVTSEEDPLVQGWTADADTTYHIKVTWWNDNIEYTLDADISD